MRFPHQVLLNFHGLNAQHCMDKVPRRVCASVRIRGSWQWTVAPRYTRSRPSRNSSNPFLFFWFSVSLGAYLCSALCTTPWDADSYDSDRSKLLAAVQLIERRIHSVSSQPAGDVRAGVDRRNRLRVFFSGVEEQLHGWIAVLFACVEDSRKYAGAG